RRAEGAVTQGRHLEERVAPVVFAGGGRVGSREERDLHRDIMPAVVVLELHVRARARNTGDDEGNGGDVAGCDRFTHAAADVLAGGDRRKLGAEGRERTHGERCGVWFEVGDDVYGAGG